MFKRNTIKTNPLKQTLNAFINNASISGTIWRASEITAISGTTLKQPVLDLGCGDGKFTKLMFMGQMDYGLDISKDAIEKSREVNAYKNYIVSDAHKIPLPNGSVQTVFSNSVFEHIPNLTSVLSEISRILKPRGVLIFTTHSPLSKQFYGVKLLKKLRLNGLAKIYESTFCRMLQLNTLWSLETWERNLQAVGISLEKTRTIVSPKSAFWYEFFMPFTFLQNRISLLKKIKISKLVLGRLKIDFSETHPEGRNFFVIAKKNG